MGLVMYRKINSVMVWATVATMLSGPANAFDKSQFVGKTKEYLLSCAGVPQRMMRSGKTEFYTYAHSRGSGGLVQMHNWGTFRTGFLNQRENGCQINFTIRGGKIVDANANWSGGLIAGPMSCNAIISNCE